MNRPSPVNRQVEDYIRSLITSKEWMPGARVPSNQALADATGTSVFTVQAALARLTKEGLIERKRRVGTFVKGGNVKLDCVGIYLGEDLWGEPSANFYQVMQRSLQTKLQSLGLKVKTWADDRPEKDRPKIFPPLKQAIDNRDIQALIAPMTNPAALRWLSKVPVATSLISAVHTCPNRVDNDDYYMLCAGLKELKAQGCKSVGIISLMLGGSNLVKPGHGLCDYYQCFAEEAEKLGMKVRNSWILFPRREESPAPSERQLFAYNQFQALWKQKERPDGLFVFPDVAAIGVITAILALRVNVPRELKLALHANDKLPYLCPVPATFIMIDTGKIADALWELIKIQNQGGCAEPITIRADIRHSEGGFPFLPTARKS